MGFREWIIQTLGDPSVVYILLVIGAIGLIAELFNLGSFYPGVIGAIALVLAYVGLGSLAINWIGAFLLLLAISLFVVDVSKGQLSFIAAGGFVAFVVGSLTLFSPWSPASPAAFEVRVNPWLIAAVTASLGAFLLLARGVVRTTRAPAAIGSESMLGRVGVAVSDLAPDGQARLDSELWSAVAEDAHIRAGEQVTVVGIEGVTLKVRRTGGGQDVQPRTRTRSWTS